MEIEFIKAQLQRRSDERQLGKVAELSGVGRRTLHRIIKGGNATLETLTKLSTFLTNTRDKKRLDDGREP